MDAVVKRLIVALGFIWLATGAVATVSADQRGLQIRPLSYETTLEAEERQQGVVDISNPNDETVNVAVTVQAFRESSDGLEFYNEPKVSGGIKLDYTNLTLHGKESFRLVFEVNAAKLPPGEVHAAVLFTTTSKDDEMVAQQVSVGTLLVIDNKTIVPTPVDESGAEIANYILAGAAIGLIVAAVVEVWRRLSKKLVLKRRS